MALHRHTLRLMENPSTYWMEKGEWISNVQFVCEHVNKDGRARIHEWHATAEELRALADAMNYAADNCEKYAEKSPV